MDIRALTEEEVLPIRQQVLWPDKPAEFCQVEGDDVAAHFGVFHHDTLVSVASIYQDGRVARLRKFATLPEFQGLGFGSGLIAHIVKTLNNANVEYFWCDARVSAMGFYQQLGMEKRGDEFYKSGVLYVKMAMKLASLPYKNAVQ